MAESYGYWMSGPIRILLGVIGAIGNILSIIVLIKQKTRKTDTDIILLGKLLLSKFNYGKKGQPIIFIYFSS